MSESEIIGNVKKRMWCCCWLKGPQTKECRQLLNLVKARK